MEIDINIKEKTITGIITDTKEDIIESIKNKSIQKIVVVKEDYLSSNFLIKVYEYMYYEIRRKRLILKNPKKKIDDSLRIVGLDDTYLNRNINSLSSSEKILVILALGLCGLLSAQDFWRGSRHLYAPLAGLSVTDVADGIHRYSLRPRQYPPYHRERKGCAIWS